MVPHPHGGGKDAVVLDIVPKHLLVLGGEGMVGFQFDAAQFLTQAVSPQAGLAVHQFVHFPHKRAGVETEGVVALLELVQFLHHGDGDNNVIILELLDGIVVVQDNVGV